MALNDVWRDIGQKVAVYSGNRLNQVPAKAGVYAWFYPLRLSTFDLGPLVDEVHKVLLFEPKSNGSLNRHTVVSLPWKQYLIGLRAQPRSWRDLVGRKAEAWAAICDDPEAFDHFRKILLTASILLPPLYVGKTDNLFSRCSQHVNGNDKNTFNRRYEVYAQSAGLTYKSVDDLLFACIETPQENHGRGDPFGMAEIVEDVLKNLCAPPFGLR